nr:hypothetical protein [Chthoniobacterales bacterium]
VTLDAIVSVSFLAIVALFYRWYGKRWREPDEITKIIIGSGFTIAGQLCLYMAAASHGTEEKIGLFWPVAFHFLNSIGFAHMLPVSLALFARYAPKAINATIIGLYYLAFFAANTMVGWIGGFLETWPTTNFWLLHAALPPRQGFVSSRLSCPLAVASKRAPDRLKWPQLLKLIEDPGHHTSDATVAARVAAVTLTLRHFLRGFPPAIGSERTADVDHILELTFTVAAHVAFVAFVRLD